MTRRQALSDLEFHPPAGIVERLAHEIGVDIDTFKKENPTDDVEMKKRNVTIDFDF